MGRKPTRAVVIIPRAIEIVEAHREGIRFSELVRELQGEFPEVPVNTINGLVWNLDETQADKVSKPSRGLFVPKVAGPAIAPSARKPVPPAVREEDFYVPLANWLKGEADECTEAMALGGKKFKDKWGTPDVIGVRRWTRRHLVEGQTEIVAAEVKADTTDLVTAFGQACSYKLFSHKSYVVAPRLSEESTATEKDDIDRIIGLCSMFGVGLVLFDATNPSEPGFDFRVWPRKHEPDLHYLNKYLQLLDSKELKSLGF